MHQYNFYCSAKTENKKKPHFGSSDTTEITEDALLTEVLQSYGATRTSSIDWKVQSDLGNPANHNPNQKRGEMKLFRVN